MGCGTGANMGCGTATNRRGEGEIEDAFYLRKKETVKTGKTGETGETGEIGEMGSRGTGEAGVRKVTHPTFVTHSCVPNAQLQAVLGGDGRRAVLVALRRVGKGDTVFCSAIEHSNQVGR